MTTYYLKAEALFQQEQKASAAVNNLQSFINLQGLNAEVGEGSASYGFQESPLPEGWLASVTARYDSEASRDSDLANLQAYLDGVNKNSIISLRVVKHVCSHDSIQPNSNCVDVEVYSWP